MLFRSLRGGIQTLDESQLLELDHLANLLADPDKNMAQLDHLWDNNDRLTVLTNNTQNIYYDTFCPVN